MSESRGQDERYDTHACVGGKKNPLELVPAQPFARHPGLTAFESVGAATTFRDVHIVDGALLGLSVASAGAHWAHRR